MPPQSAPTPGQSAAVVTGGPARGECGPELSDWAQHAADSNDPSGWDRCARQVADSYHVRVDSAGRTGRPRYIAVARSLSVRPYAVVTSDPVELLQALGCTDLTATAPPARKAAR